VFPARYELNSYIVFRKRLVSKRLTRYVGTTSLYIMHISNDPLEIQIQSAIQNSMLCLLDLLVTSECDRKVVITL
jgi:hypothetical protein